MDSLIITVALMAMGGLLSTYLVRYMHKSFYDERDWAKNNYVAMVLIYLADWALGFSINMLEISYLNLIGMILTYFLPLLICYKVKHSRGIIYYIFYVVMNLVVELILAGFMGVLNIGMGLETRYESLTPMVMIIMNLSEIAIVLFICKIGGKARGDKVTKTTWLFLTLPFFTFLIIIYEMTAISTGWWGNANIDQFMFLDVVLMAINIIVFIMLEKYTSLMKHNIANREEKIRLESDAEILEIATAAMRDRLEASEKIVQTDRVMRHDRRHFEALMLTLLQEGKSEEAQNLLEERLQEEPHALRQYCENSVLNAAIGHYVYKAEAENIDVQVMCNIPSNLKIDEMELAIAISNLLENAIHACEKAEGQRYIKITSKYKNQLLLEIENSCGPDIKLDENGHPETTEQGHGVGTKSILSFVNKSGSEIFYQVKDGVFKVRMIIEA